MQCQLNQPLLSGTPAFLQQKHVKRKLFDKFPSFNPINLSQHPPFSGSVFWFYPFQFERAYGNF